MEGFLDLHQHIVFGVDDGPGTLEEAARMLEAARAGGVTRIVGTSHALPSMERFPLERYYRHLRALNVLSMERGLGVRVYDGCEVFYSDAAVRKLCEGELPTLARSRFVLVEFDPTSRFEAIAEAVRRLGNAGFIPILAHCERYAALVKNPSATLALRWKLRMRIQLNASAIIQRRPRAVRRFCDLLLDEGGADYIATDAHNLTTRPPHLRQAYDQLAKRYGRERAWLLTGGNQGEVLGEGRTAVGHAR